MTNIEVVSCRLALRGIAISFCAASYLFAQPLSLTVRAPKSPEGEVAETPTHIIRADVNMVLVPTVVMDRKGATVNSGYREVEGPVLNTIECHHDHAA